MENQQKIILKDWQIKKFSAYGFLKDLKFFEPYLLIYLMGNNITLLQIGILFAIREVIVNVFEIPSGFLADYFGRKKELSFSFLMYIVSFGFFYFSSTFWIAVVAMVFFGLGEAFRSGTHKAMIFTYLEQKGWAKQKTFVYGKTRSASLIGAALSAILSVIIILNVPNNGYIFLASIIPYILDFVLIMSYPKSLDNSDKEKRITFKQMIQKLIKAFKVNKNLRHILIGEGFFEGAISSIKDFIQPILEIIIIGSGMVLISTMSSEDNLNIILGITYMFLNIFGSVASRNSYRLKKYQTGIFLTNFLYFSLVVVLAVLGLLIEYYYAVIICYLIIYLTQNFRKPIFIDELDENMPKDERATVLSIASQMKSLFIIVLAPLIGLVSDTYGIKYALIGLAILLLIFSPFVWYSSKNNAKEVEVK